MSNRIALNQRAEFGLPVVRVSKTAIADEISGAVPSFSSGQALTFTIRLQPIGKPRMTQRDKWKKRPVVVRYREWADKARLQAPTALIPVEPLRLKIRAYFEMPKSWSSVKKSKHAGQYHRAKPDWDNIGKAVQDIFWKNDQMVADAHVTKHWDDGGGARVEVEVI